MPNRANNCQSNDTIGMGIKYTFFIKSLQRDGKVLSARYLRIVAKFFFKSASRQVKWRKWMKEILIKYSFKYMKRSFNKFFIREQGEIENSANHCAKFS